MSTLTVTLGRPSTVVSASARWDRNITIPNSVGSPLRTDTTSTSNLVITSLRFYSSFSYSRFNLNPTGAAMTDTWEQAAVSFTLRCDGIEDLRTPGPNYADWSTADGEEPYTWIYGTSFRNDVLGPWLTAYFALTNEQRDTTVLILDDGVPRPNAPTGLTAVAGTTHVDLAWTAPTEGDPPTGYEVSTDSGAWTPTGSANPGYRASGLTPGVSYSFRVRAVNSAATGPASAAATATTVLGAPRHPTVTVRSATQVLVEWEPPADPTGITGYQVSVSDPAGGDPAWETAGSTGSHPVAGLAQNERYTFAVRATGAANSTSAATPTVAAIPAPNAETGTVSGARIPIDQTARQSLVVQLGGQDCLLLVWWNPTDEAWYANLEVPQGTTVARGRRLAVNAGLLAGIPDVLAGDIVCRATSAADAVNDPGENAWATGTHGLFWEPAAG